MVKTNDIVEFLWHYARDKESKSVYTKEKIKEKIRKHMEYKTCRIILDDNDSTILACCFWNIDPDCIVADIQDMVIREDGKKYDLMRRILINGLKVWPVKFIRYHRDYTQQEKDERPPRVWSVERFLRRRPWA